MLQVEAIRPLIIEEGWPLHVSLLSTAGLQSTEECKEGSGDVFLQPAPAGASVTHVSATSSEEDSSVLCL